MISMVHVLLGLAGKRWREDDDAKAMLTSSAENAASRATAEWKAITSRLLHDAAERDRRLAQRHEAMMEKLTGLVRGVSDSMDRGCKINEDGGARDADERWKNRMANENKITANTIEALRSDLDGVSAKMAGEVVCLKNSQHGSAASTLESS